MSLKTFRKSEMTKRCLLFCVLLGTMPDLTADCAMAHMVNLKKIQKMREQYEDLAVVCYINSTAEIKTCEECDSE